MKALVIRLASAALVGAAFVVPAAGQQTPAAAPAVDTGAAPPVVVPHNYIIGADDIIAVVFWRDKDMSAEVVVRPDGKISLPLLNDIAAAGLTPDQLRANVEKAAAKYIENPNATVIVKTINSRKVHIVGNVAKAGTYVLQTDMSVLQLIATAGGLQEFADGKNIVVMRKEDGRDRAMKFNYNDVVRQKNIEQNITLRPGDTVIVP